MSKLLKCISINSNKLDRITELPDGILETILSNLPFKEAVATCVLSHRWRTCWKFSKVFNFDASHVLLLHHTALLLVKKQWWYIDIATRGLASMESSTMESIKLCFVLSYFFQRHIDGWIKLALDKETHNLHLNLHPTRPNIPFHHVPFNSGYYFPMNLLAHTNIKSFISITLKHIEVTEEVFHSFLTSCPFLETLCIRGTGHLVNLTVAGPSLALKHLKLSSCHEMKSIRISAPRLLSFKYYGDGIIFDIESAPLLTMVCIGNDHYFMFWKLIQLSRCFSRLKSLTLNFRGLNNWESFGNFPELRNLSHLKIHGIPAKECRHLPFLSFVERCPALHSLNIKKTAVRDENLVRSDDLHTIKTIRNFSLKYLKLVDFSGFIGSKSDNEILLFLFEISVSLDKLIIHIAEPIGNSLEISPARDITETDRQHARDFALRLELPPGTQLVVL